MYELQVAAVQLNSETKMAFKDSVLKRVQIKPLISLWNESFEKLMRKNRSLLAKVGRNKKTQIDNPSEQLGKNTPNQ